MTYRRQPNRALELLSHFVPGHVLEEARTLAEQIEKEDRERDELGDSFVKAFVCAFLSLVFLVVTFVGAIFVLGLLGPATPLVELSVLILWVLSWALGTAAMIYFMLPQTRRAMLIRLFRKL